MKEELIIKFLRGECSTLEERQISQWLDNPAAQVQLEKIMEKYWENPDGPIADPTDYSSLLGKIHRRIQTRKTTPKLCFQSIAIRSLKIAASVILVVFSGYFLTRSWVNTEDPKEISATNSVKSIERSTGIGEKLTLTMPDGTRIIVNSESTLQFNSDYGRTDRTISLSGEAYFDVAPDSLKPFRVATGGFITQAIGTAFNISTKHPSIKVALTEGKVKVGAGKNEVNLDPGQMAVWEPSDQIAQIRVKNFNIEKVTAWKDGRLAFDAKALGQILEDLENWYGVTIQTNPDLDLNQRISGTFENNNLKDVLTGLSFSTHFSFELNEKHVTLKKRL